MGKSSKKPFKKD